MRTGARGRFFSATFRCDQGANSVVTKRQISAPSFGGRENLPTRSFVRNSGGPNLESLMKSPIARGDINCGRLSDWPKPGMSNAIREVEDFLKIVSSTCWM